MKPKLLSSIKRIIMSTLTYLIVIQLCILLLLLLLNLKSWLEYKETKKSYTKLLDRFSETEYPQQ